MKRIWPRCLAFEVIVPAFCVRRRSCGTNGLWEAPPRLRRSAVAQQTRGSGLVRECFIPVPNTHRVYWPFRGQVRSHKNAFLQWFTGCLIRGGLPAMNDDAMFLTYRVDCIAGKPPPTVQCLLQDSAVSETQGHLPRYLYSLSPCRLSLDAQALRAWERSAQLTPLLETPLISPDS